MAGVCLAGVSVRIGAFGVWCEVFFCRIGRGFDLENESKPERCRYCRTHGVESWDLVVRIRKQVIRSDIFERVCIVQ